MSMKLSPWSSCVEISLLKRLTHLRPAPHRIIARLIRKHAIQRDFARQFMVNSFTKDDKFAIEK
jgi:hypothetical protein